MQYTRIPQSFFDILPQLSGADAKILLVVYRCTIGWNKRTAIISLSVMAKHTGITTRQITESIKRLKTLGIVHIEQTTKGYRYTVEESSTHEQTIEETSIEESSIPEQTIEETSMKVSKKLLPYKEKKESNTTTSNDVVRKRARNPKQVPPADEQERTALTVFRQIHRLNVPIALRDTVLQVVSDIDRWEVVCTEWIGRGYRPGNVNGCMNVYQKGWGNDRPQQRQRGDVQQQRRNERMAQTIAEYDK